MKENIIFHYLGGYSFPFQCRVEKTEGLMHIKLTEREIKTLINQLKKTYEAERINSFLKKRKNEKV